MINHNDFDRGEDCSLSDEGRAQLVAGSQDHVLSDAALADADEILHHITVADVEALHGMALTEDQAEQVKDRLARALTAVINEIRDVGSSEITSDNEMTVERQILRDCR